MLPNLQGRHCLNCQKTVVDFTSMTDTELVNYFKKNTGNTCGRFTNDQLQRDILVPKKKINWMKYFFQMAIPAFFLSFKAGAQNDTTKASVEIMDSVKTVLRTDTSTTDVYPVDSELCIEDKYPTALDSTFIFPKFETAPVCITVPSNIAMGFSVIEVLGDVNIQTKLLPDVPFSDFLSKIFKNKSPLPIPVNLPTIPSSTIATLFPNPIKSGNTLQINWENADAGDYHFTIANSDGNPVQEGSFYLEEKAGSSSIALMDLAAGNYVLTIVNTGSEEKFTQQFIVF